MGPCATCGQLTEPEVDFCPTCAGYAAPATIYSYAPSRLSHFDGELAQIMIPLAPAYAPAEDAALAAAPEDAALSAAAADTALSAPAENGTLTAPAQNATLAARADHEMVPAPADDEPLTAPTPDAPVTAGIRPTAVDLAARLRTTAARRREGRWLVASAMLIVLIIATGTVLLELGRPRPASPPPTRPADSTRTPAATPSVPPSPPGLPISVAPAAASSPHETAVLPFLSSYFTAINNHDFAAYQQLFSPPLRAELTATMFTAGYGTTTDSAITLTDIGVIGAGELVAQVTFISHQQAVASPTDSACTSWSVSLYLLQQGSSYLLQQPPAGYQASYSACS